MCVIVICDKRRMTALEVRDAITANPDGNGVAWIDNGRVAWSKGLTDEILEEYAATLPLPYVIHTRFSTVGGTPDTLAHPFPIGGDLELCGLSKRGVLFHNGHWNEWNTVMLRTLPSPKAFPRGPWSDSRAMAYLVRAYGNNVLDLLPSSQKVALMTPKGVQRWGTGWVTEQGILYSNTSFRYTAPKAAQAPATNNHHLQPYQSPYRFKWDSTDRDWYTPAEIRAKSIHDLTDEEWATVNETWEGKNSQNG